MGTQKLLLGGAAHSEHSASESHDTEIHLGLVAMVPTLGLLLTHHDLLIGWGKKTGKQQAWFPVHLALQRFMCSVFTTHEKLCKLINKHNL